MYGRVVIIPHAGKQFAKKWAGDWRHGTILLYTTNVYEAK